MSLVSLVAHPRFKITEGMEFLEVASKRLYRALQGEAQDTPLVSCLEMTGGTFRLTTIDKAALRNSAAFSLHDSMSTAYALEMLFQVEFFTLSHSRGWEQRLDLFGAQFKARTRAKLYACALLHQWG